MNSLNTSSLEQSDEITSKKAWGKPEISELRTSLTSGSKGATGFEQTSTSIS